MSFFGRLGFPFVWRGPVPADASPDNEPADASPDNEPADAPPDNGPGAAPNAHSHEPPQPFFPEPADVGAARGILKSVGPGLPTELADMILDRADYHVKDRKVFNPGVGGETIVYSNKGSTLVLQAPPIRKIEQQGPELRDLKIKAVRFELESHDQGWGGDQGTQGTYSSAWSWFEASIIRRCPVSDVDPLTPASQWSRVPEEWAPYYKRMGWDFVRDENDKVRLWPVQKNKVATKKTETHEIVWSPGGSFEGPGSGSGEGFVSSLRPGDVIQLWARAMFPGWVNYVITAAVEVDYAD